MDVTVIMTFNQLSPSGIEEQKTYKNNISKFESDFTNTAKLRFSDTNETAFQKFRLDNFLSQDKFLLMVGIFIYLVFALADIVILPAPFSGYALIGRLLIVIAMVLSLWLTFYKKQPFFQRYCIEIFGLLLIATGWHAVIISCMCPFPYDYTFLLGTVTMVSTTSIIFRLNFRICLFVSLAIFLAVAIFLLFASVDRVVDTKYHAVNDILNAFPYVFPGFLLAIAATNSYLSYFFERSFRRQWLQRNISRLESEQLQKLTIELQQISRIDSLTQLYNRRYFFEQAATLLAVHQRQKEELSIIMLDVDLFKKYNDTYGHVQGDNCLKQVAQSFQSCCRRSSDIIARYGGEEFIVFLANTCKEDALSTAEHIRKYIDDLNIPHIKSPFKRVTVSLGVTTHNCEQVTHIKDIIALADDALYKSKRNGRNQVSYSDKLEMTGNLASL